MQWHDTKKKQNKKKRITEGNIDLESFVTRVVESKNHLLSLP